MANIPIPNHYMYHHNDGSQRKPSFNLMLCCRLNFGWRRGANFQQPPPDIGFDDEGVRECPSDDAVDGSRHWLDDAGESQSTPQKDVRPHSGESGPAAGAGGADGTADGADPA